MSELGHGNGPTGGYDSPAARAHQTQTVLNTAWPYRDSAGPHARGTHDKPANQQINVTVRIVFSTDGEQWLNGRAITWANGCVMVAVDDKRLRPGLVWVRGHDVRRV